MYEARVLRGPGKCPLGFPGRFPEDLRKLVRVLFPELVLNAGQGRGSCVTQERTFQGKKADSSQPVSNSPECESVKGRALASSESLVTCCWSGNGLLLITPIVICLGKMPYSHLLKAAMVFSEIICFQGSSI